MRRPLFARHNLDEVEAWEGPFEGVPPWLFASANQWVTRRFDLGEDMGGRRRFDAKRLLRVQRELRLTLSWSTTSSAMRSLLGYLDDEKYGPAILDWCVGNATHIDDLLELKNALYEAGSAWTIGIDENDVPELQRRVDETTTAAIKSAAPAGTRPAHHLSSAWSKVYGQHPDPSAGYSQAVKAVEAAAHLVISPNNEKATLGTMIRDMRAAPHKWATTLQPSSGGNGTVQITEMMQLLWSAQLDRHGSSSTAAPLAVSLAEAAAALHVAASLVYLFRSGAISVV